MEKVGRKGANLRSFPDHSFCLCGLSSFFFLFSISFFPEIRWRRSLAWQTEVTTQGGCKRNTLKRAAQAQSEVQKEENNPVTILDQNATFPQIWGQLVLQVLLKLLNKNQIQS